MAQRPDESVAADVVVVPVLRAGLGMLDAILDLAPQARVGHIGLQRDEMTAVASQYYAKFPGRLDSSFVLMVDPMLATGGSAIAALELLGRAGARRVNVVCIVAAPEGVAALEQRFPNVHIFTPVIDERSEREQVHRAGSRRLRRSSVRYQLTDSAAASEVSHDRSHVRPSSAVRSRARPAIAGRRR